MLTHVKLKRHKSKLSEIGKIGFKKQKQKNMNIMVN